MADGADSLSFAGRAIRDMITVLRILRQSLAAERVCTILGGPAVSEGAGDKRIHFSCDGRLGIDADWVSDGDPKKIDG